MVFNATINNISAISQRPVLLAEEYGVPGENHDIVILFVNQPLTVLNLPVLIVRLFIFIGAIVVMIVW
jgi:hypothetical protein